MEKTESSKYERLMSNLHLLESRNPDLGRLLSIFDVWLENFVKVEESTNSASQEVKNASTPENAPSPVTTKTEPNQTPENSGVPTAKKDSGIRILQQYPGPMVSVDVKKTESVPAASSVPYANSVTKTATTGNAERAVESMPAPASTLRSGLRGSMAETSGTSYSSQPDSQVSDSESWDSGKGEVGSVISNGLWRNEDIDQLEKRLLLKIEASRWALERDRLLKNAVNFQTEIEPKDHNLLSRARELTNCYLWMNNPETAPVIATETYEMLADAYAAAASCVGFMRQLIDLVDRSPKSEILSRILRDALYITATAQSALRRVTYDVSGREDQDQIRIHRWLTLLTKRYGIYVNRHMKKDSLAPKDRIYVIPEYIGRLKKEVEKLGQRQKILTEGFRRIQYHASRMTSQNGNDYDWNKIIETVDELVDAGIPANDVRFESALKSILPSLKNVPTYKEHPFFINVLMELDYWHENEAQKARVARELSQMPPQPKVTSEPSADDYTSVWDEMERGITPESESVQMDSRVATEQEKPAENSDSSNKAENSTPRNEFSPVFSHTEANSGAGSSAGSQPGPTVSENRDSLFANYSSTRKTTQGFGQGILGNRDEKTPKVGEVHGTGAVGAAPSDQPLRYVGNSTYSRLAGGHLGVPSYASVVSEKAHAHHETETTNPEDDEIVQQAREAIRGKTLIFVDGKGDSSLKDFLQEKLAGTIAFAGEEQIASEMKIAQLVHPVNVAVVLMVEGSVPTANRNVENYCRHYDKPLLRVNRELDINSLARQIVAAMTLWR